MKNLTLYQIATVLVFMSKAAYAVKFDIKQGFIYEAKEIEQQKMEEQKKKLSQPFVKVLRLFNEDNKISDPVLTQTVASNNKEIEFMTIKDKTLVTDHEQAARDVAALNGALDWVSIEKVLLEVESQFGIRSMPVVQFTDVEKLDKQSFAHRVEYLENKLSIVPENKKYASLPQRLNTIKQKLNIETETLGLDVNF